MIKIWQSRLCCLVLMLFALAPAPASQDETSNSEPRDPRAWFFTQSFGDLPEELQTAREQGKLGMMLFFESEGCSYCLRMLRGIFNQPVVQDWYRDRFVSIAVDIHGDVELTDFDGITLPSKVFSDHRKVFLTPVLSFINLQGDEIYRHVGSVRSVEEFMLIGQYIEGEHYFDTEFRVFAKKHGSSLDPVQSTPASTTDHRLDQPETLP